MRERKGSFCTLKKIYIGIRCAAGYLCAKAKAKRIHFFFIKGNEKLKKHILGVREYPDGDEQWLKTDKKKIVCGSIESERRYDFLMERN